MIELQMNEDKTECIRFEISTFKDVEYLSIRKWYRANGRDDMGFNTNADTWFPTKEGVSLSVPRNMDNEFFHAILNVVKNSETASSVEDLNTDDIPF